MPVSVSTAGISLTLSPYGHSPYLICDEQRERSPDFCHLHCRYFLTPPFDGHLPYILHSKTQGRRKGTHFLFLQSDEFLYNEIKQYNLLPCRAP